MTNKMETELDRIKITGEMNESFKEILSPEALSFITKY